MTEYSQDRFGIPVPESSTYAWVITHVNTRDLGEDMADDVGTAGPHNAPENLLTALKAGEGYTFRMLDDDGVWCYRGRLLATNDGEPEGVEHLEGLKPGTIVCRWAIDEEEGFGPLYDFGAPNVGCTEIEYRVEMLIPGAGYKTRKVWAVL